VSEIIKRSDLNDYRASTIMNMLFKEIPGGKLEMKSSYFKPIVELAFAYIEVHRDYQPPEMFDSSLLFKIVRMQGTSHPFEKKLIDRIKKFAQSLVSKQIVLKDINSNFNNKRNYLE
jgi:hypothetical protein